MSRSNKNNASASAQRLPPSHPIEQFPEHQQFLIRSLERNDKEIAALMELTRTIKSVKQEIIDRCGELTLLDLGCGKIRLSPTCDGLEMDEDEESTAESDKNAPSPPLDARARELCVDCLLRLKLRRKLLSRVFRRVHRVAHAMDGNDVSPPVPPKYGDLRIHIEPSEAAAYNELWQRQEAARKLMDQLREEALDKEFEQQKAALEQGNDTNGAAAMDVERPETSKSTGDQSAESRVVDYDAFLSYDEGYEKLINPDTGDFKYTILDQPYEEDHVKIKTGSGIGAVQRGMTVKEKENEYNRWQTALLGRIPEQPTYADLGLEHRVFLLDERRKRALEAAKEAPAKKRTFADDNDERPEKGRGGKSLRKLQEEKDAKEKSKLHPDHSDIDTEHKDKEAPSDKDGEEKEKEDEALEADKDVDDAASGVKPDEADERNVAEDKDVEDEVIDNTEAIIRRRNPISLAPVPSFYEQDLKRIRLIQGELLASSMQAHSRQRLEEVIREYNQVMRASQDSARRRQQVDTKLQQVIYEIKREHAEHQAKVSVAHGEWLKRLHAFNHDKLNKTLKSRWNQQPQGTGYTNHYGTFPDPLRKEVARCGADLVDAVELIVEGKVANPKFNEPFVPPPDVSRMSEIDPGSGQISQQKQRIQQHYKKESDSLAQQFRQHEDERQRAWRRMLKVKAELNLSQQIVSNHRLVPVSINEQNFHLIPMPNIAVASVEAVPRELDVSRTALPSYVPAHHHARVPGRTTGDAESKYAISRVRARTSADGSVAPISLPKRGADGLYARPAGRTRKGMVQCRPK